MKNHSMVGTGMAFIIYNNCGVPREWVYVWKLNPAVFELDFWAVNFLFSLDGIRTRIINILQHHLLSLMSTALDQ